MDRRKLLLIFGGAWLSAALLTWFLWAQTQAPKTEKSRRVVAAARELGAGTRLRRGDLKLVSLPERDSPARAVVDPRQAEDRVLLFPVSTNEPLIETKLSKLAGAEGLAATIDPGRRAIAVPITDISGVSGLLQPRSRVDVLFTRTGSMAEALTTTLLEDIPVLSIGRVTEAQPAASSSTAQASQTNVNATQMRAATLLVTPEEARKLELAKNQGKVALALRNPLDRGTVADPTPATAESIDPELFSRVSRQRLRQRPPVDVRDPAAWNALAGLEAPPAKPREEKKEPPKPKHIVDVFRGDKHVQEIFQ